MMHDASTHTQTKGFSDPQQLDPNRDPASVRNVISWATKQGILNQDGTIQREPSRLELGDLLNKMRYAYNFCSWLQKQPNSNLAPFAENFPLIETLAFKLVQRQNEIDRGPKSDPSSPNMWPMLICTYFREQTLNHYTLQRR